MTVLATGLSTLNTPNLATSGGRTYHFNDFDPPQVWDGQWATTRDMGIDSYATAPTVANTGAAGSITAGLHQIRYRYQDTTSEYVSDPTPASTLTAPGAQGINVTVVASSDTKVNRILIEMTPVNSTDFYVAAEVANSGATITITTMSDAVLVVQQAVGDTYGDFGQEIPPLTANGCAHRGRMFLFGQNVFTLTVDCTNGDATVSALIGTFPDDANFNWNGRIIRLVNGSDDFVYQIQSTTSSTEIELTEAFTGTTQAYTATIYRKTPNRIWWSKELYPEGFTVLESFRDMLQGRPDRLVGGVSFGGELWVFGRFSAERLIYDSDPGVVGGQVIPVAGNRGAHNQRCLLEVDGTLYCWDRQGIWIAEASGSQHVSLPIDDYLTANADYTQASEFFMAFDPSMRILYAFFTATGDTKPKWAACYEIDTKNWYLASFLQGILSATIVPTTAGVVKLMLGDQNGKLWFAGTAGSFDGRQGTDTNVLAYASGTTTISFLPALSTDPTGRMLYRASTGEARAVALWGSTTTLSINPAFSSPAMVVGEELYLAPIIVTWQTKWWTGEGLRDKKKPLYLFIESIPRAIGVLVEVSIYTDFSTTAETWTAGSLDTFPDGVSVTNGGQTILATLGSDGFVAIPLGSDWKRAYQARVQQRKPVGDLEITAIYFGTSRTTTKEDEGE